MDIFTFFIDLLIHFLNVSLNVSLSVVFSLGLTEYAHVTLIVTFNC